MMRSTPLLPNRSIVRRLGVACVALVLAACSGSGGDADVDPSAPVSVTVADESGGTAPPSDASTPPPPTTGATTTTTEPPPEPLPVGVRWTDHGTLVEIGQEGRVGDLVRVGDELWLLGRQFNGPFAARTPDGQSWTEVTLRPVPTDGAVGANGIVQGPDGRLVVHGGRAYRCGGNVDAGNGYRLTGFCKRSRPVLFVSDDDGSTWTEIEPPAMAPPGDSSVVLADVVATATGYVAAGTVRGPDWHVRLWTSPDGQDWTLAREIRGTQQYASARWLLFDGETLALLVTEHPCAMPNDNTPGWILGTTWILRPHVYTGASVADLVDLPADAHPLLRTTDPYDCAATSIPEIEAANAATPLFDGAVVGGEIVLVAGEPAVEDDEEDDEDDDDDEEVDESIEYGGGSRQLARLSGGTWTAFTIDGVQIPRAFVQPMVFDVDGEIGLSESRSFDGTRIELLAVLPDGAGGQVQMRPETPVVGRADLGAAWIDGRLVVVGTSLRDPYSNLVGGENPFTVSVWTSQDEPGGPPPCDLVAGGSCRHGDLSTVDGYPDFADRDLTGVDLSFADLGDADFSGADLSGARLWGATARSGSTVRGARFVGAELQAAELYDAVGADFTGANLARARVVDVGGAVLVGAVLDRARITVFELPDLDGVVLAGVDLDFADPSEGGLAEVSLAGLDLTDVLISGPFDGPLLRITSLDGAVIDGTDFLRTDLRAVDLTVDLSLADVWDTSICPDGLPPDDPPIGTCVRGLADD